MANGAPAGSAVTAQSDEHAAALMAHSRHYAMLLEREGPHLNGGGSPDEGRAQMVALKRLGIELGNILAALDTGEDSLRQAFARHCALYFEIVGDFIELRDHFA